jgi:glycosyltransferase involved in cell wall biosynthesis
MAGVVVFSFSDDWFKGGRSVEDWAMGLTTAERTPKPSFQVVQRRFREAPYFSLGLQPKVSVVVACYNGAATLRGCLESLSRLSYPDYEVILVDDGSTDATHEIALMFPQVRYINQPNHGLSVARNTGITAARGEIIAFTDADCRADEDWLYYLVGDLSSGRFTGMGGPNFLPVVSGRWRRLAGLTRSFAERGTMWTFAGVCSSAGIGSGLVQPGLCGTIVAPTSRRICASKVATAKPKRCWSESIPNILTP